MAAILILSGTCSGGLVGLLTAIVAAPLPQASANVALVLIGLGLCLDALRLISGSPSPPTSGKQVPREWGRLLNPPVVAMLYGARLGVGPLTILSTWTWWSVTIAAALVGPVAAMAVGMTFGAVRLLVTVGASLISSRSAAVAATPRTHADRFGKLRAGQRPNWLVINGLGFIAIAAFAVAGCAKPSEQTANPGGGTATTVTTIENRTSTTKADLLTTTTAGLPAIYSADLEDFVRTLTPNADSTATNDSAKPGLEPGAGPDLGETDEPTVAVPSVVRRVSSAPEDLKIALTASIDGFEPVEEPLADRFLDIVAASELQPDPTEEIALLETRGFEGGWTRAFRNGHNDVAVASVYQFEDAAEAEFYLEDGLITIGGYGGKFFDVEGLPGVRGFVQYFSETDENGTEDLVSLGAAFQAGPRWYLVYFVGSTDSVTPEVLIPAIAAQRQTA